MLEEDFTPATDIFYNLETQNLFFVVICNSLYKLYVTTLTFSKGCDMTEWYHTGKSKTLLNMHEENLSPFSMCPGSLC